MDGSVWLCNGKEMNLWKEVDADRYGDDDADDGDD